MPSVNIRQLRDTRRLKAWLQAGETVELRERNQLLARIVPEPVKAKPGEWPDFGRRARKLFGHRLLPGATLVVKERGRY
jgi:antitoxin (DNA-binding transcriptional repressor) of toxin-antitoxin stability system